MKLCVASQHSFGRAVTFASLIFTWYGSRDRSGFWPFRLVLASAFSRSSGFGSGSIHARIDQDRDDLIESARFDGWASCLFEFIFSFDKIDACSCLNAIMCHQSLGCDMKTQYKSV